MAFEVAEGAFGGHLSWEGVPLGDILVRGGGGWWTLRWDGCRLWTF